MASLKRQRATDQTESVESSPDPYDGIATPIPPSTIAPKDAKTGRIIERKVEREADRLMRGSKGDAPASDPYADISVPVQAGEVQAATNLQQPAVSSVDPGRFASTTPLRQPPPLNASELVSDVVKSAGSGVVKGVAGLAALPGTIETLGRVGINYANRQFGGSGEIGRAHV